MPDIQDLPHEVYADYAASTPPLPEAIAAIAESASQSYGNPSSAHGPGRAARERLEQLRRELESLCGFTGGRLLFTSSATEANNWIIHGLMQTAPAGRVLVAQNVHASVWGPCQCYANRMDVLPLDSNGHISLAALRANLKGTTQLVCCSHVCSETGIIQDVAAFAAACEQNGVLCHIDGAQALGHIPVNLDEVNCDYYVFGAHKFGGPRGCGGMFARSPRLSSWLQGGAQEWNLRAGTENLPAISGTVAALRYALIQIADEMPRLRRLTAVVVDYLRQANAAFLINGQPECVRPGVLSLSFPGCQAHALAADLAIQGIAVAVGSACSSDRPDPSRAIIAMGRSVEAALGTLRISFGRLNQMADAESVARGLVAALQRHAPSGEIDASLD
jgi:cysteine desulfurase